MNALLFHDADAESRQIVILAVIHAGHFGRFAADQRASGLHAPLDDAGDEAFTHIDVEFAGGKVVQKEQRLGALNHHVVDAHGDQIDAHRVVAAGVDGEAQFGADPVGSRHQYGLAVAIDRHFHEGAETAQPAQYLAAHGALHVGFDAFDEFLAGVDVDSGLAIGDGGSLSHSIPLKVRAGRPHRRGRPASCGILHQATQCFPDNTMAQYISVFSLRNLRAAVFLCLSLAALCPGNAALALTRAQLFQATAPLDDRSEAAQTAAFQAAMKVILVRVTGRRSAEEDPALAPLIGNARRYVQQYRAAADGQIWVSFDGPAIERWLDAKRPARVGS